MCEIIEYPFSELFDYTKDSNFICDINKLEIKDVENISSISSLISPIMTLLLGTGKIPELSHLIVNAVYNEYKKYNRLPNVWSAKNEYKQVDDNLWNYSVAKSFHFLRNLGRIANGDKDKIADRAASLNKLMFNDQQKVETLQVNRTTEVVKNVKYGKILKYVSEGDSNVRPTHKAANGTTLPANDKFWITAGALLGEWNCRCSVIEVLDTSTQLQRPLVKIEPDKRTNASKIDIESGKVQVFAEHLPMFSGTKVVRKYFRGENK